mmetsp:Transcript_53410/g.117251  ORF Transcript_53410/g.117251 Transcript_53410/m.117251 type:complete len:371 (+) Transcript_53410:39-1151(+)|eukprot:CAMPEP_0204319042 /NCGR_PEP_ID=MMETSP0469-20131031/6873_1 /ASSEMBLY_ACC=CAM_ASM_000384 /TAXON_ID=2969 /ORGANISM="Oxyrrhis marina" /LENGTH=370 /DNA_ID=CAMNT_0051300163 /DNA_START=39 /DNA_END=1151 /DNA_ORIENTATION=+
MAVVPPAPDCVAPQPPSSDPFRCPPGLPDVEATFRKAWEEGGKQPPKNLALENAVLRSEVAQLRGILAKTGAAARWDEAQIGLEGSRGPGSQTSSEKDCESSLAEARLRHLESALVQLIEQTEQSLSAASTPVAPPVRSPTFEDILKSWGSGASAEVSQRDVRSVAHELVRNLRGLVSSSEPGLSAELPPGAVTPILLRPGSPPSPVPPMDPSLPMHARAAAGPAVSDALVGHAASLNASRRAIGNLLLDVERRVRALNRAAQAEQHQPLREQVGIVLEELVRLPPQLREIFQHSKELVEILKISVPRANLQQMQARAAAAEMELKNCMLQLQLIRASTPEAQAHLLPACGMRAPWEPSSRHDPSIWAHS